MNSRAVPIFMFALLGAIPAMGQPASAPGHGGGSQGLGGPGYGGAAGGASGLADPAGGGPAAGAAAAFPGGFAGAGPGAGASGDAPGAVPHFTTPTADYCAHLNREVARQGPGPDGTARALADEGARMCDRGQFRGGVVRLRRALALMRSGR